jgi:hypothetical protein
MTWTLTTRPIRGKARPRRLTTKPDVLLHLEDPGRGCLQPLALPALVRALLSRFLPLLLSCIVPQQRRERLPSPREYWGEGSILFPTGALEHCRTTHNTTLQLIGTSLKQLRTLAPHLIRKQCTAHAALQGIRCWRGPGRRRVGTQVFHPLRPVLPPCPPQH